MAFKGPLMYEESAVRDTYWLGVAESVKTM
jgi:hypothetical protein